MTARDDVEAGEAIEKATSWMEGGLMYPTGFVVAAFPSPEDARTAQQGFLDSGVSTEECLLISAEKMAETASRELEDGGAVGALGSSEQVRQKQLQLAREGCAFLMVKAASDEQKGRALAELRKVPVRYAVLYRRLVIEDLIPHIESATADSEPARKR